MQARDNKKVKKAHTNELREQAEKELYDAFTLLGRDAAEADVEFALAAQVSVISSDTSLRPKHALLRRCKDARD